MGATTFDRNRPKPADEADQKRWEVTGQRRRIVSGVWTEDARTRLLQWFAVEAAAFLPDPDTTHNAALMIYTRIAVLYDEDPVVETEDGEEDDDALDPLNLHLIWPVQQERNLYVESLGECAIRVDWSETEDRATVRVVPPDCLVCYAPSDAPEVPYRFEELRDRYITDGGTTKKVWTWDVWDISDPANPVFRVERDGDGGRRDITADVLGEDAGWPEHYRKADGTPVLPYILYHRRLGSRLWDYSFAQELFDGTLDQSVRWTWWNGLLRDASWPQRAIVDGYLSTGTSEVTTGQAEATIRTDPTTVLVVRSTGGGSARLDQWNASVDPLTFGTALSEADRVLAQYAGLDPADVVAGQSASGYSIVVRREGLRRAQRRQIPPASVGDKRLLALLSTVTNRVTGGTLPEEASAWRVTYGTIGRSPEEVKAQVDADAAEVAVGSLSVVDIIQRKNPGMSWADARERAIENAQVRAEIAAAAAGVPIMPEPSREDTNSTQETT